jgi:tight adherence protein B
MTTVTPAALAAAMAVWVAAAPPRAAVRLRALVGTPAPSTPAVLVRMAGRRVRELRSRRRRTSERRAAVIELCDGFGAELAAGRSPETALAHAASAADPDLRRLLMAAPGDDVAAALDTASTLPGAEGLRLLAGCWRIGAERGGTFAVVVDGLAAALRDEEAHRADLAAQLAGPRATARLLAGLPLLGLAMAAALGARPVAFLLGTVPGMACLLAGVALDIAGLGWTRRLAANAEVTR